MIPSYCPDSASPGEKSVYSKLQCSEETSGWIVLHSLAIAEHVRQVEGEVDFVVIVPDVGILVLEIKSHLTIDRRSDGYWKLGNDAPTVRGPFQQADEGKHSLRGYLQKKGVDLRSVPMISAVWFTGVRARTMLPEGPEWHDWQVLDSEDLATASSAILRTLAGGTQHLDDKITYFSYGGHGPNSSKAERIAGLLRPRFEMATVAGDRRRARENHLITFIEEQYLALDAVSDNRRVLFSGPAGSGKTFLAMEAARREVGMGNRGRLLCFNRLLGQRLRSDMGDLGGLQVGTFHQSLLRIVGNSQVPSDPTRDFWRHELPELAAEAIIDGGVAPAEFLIVDEIQDLATSSYLDVLDLMVEGGLRDGRVLLFGDFERQSVFENDQGRDLLRTRVSGMPTFKLVHNCRNLPRIGYQTNILSHFHPGYQVFRRIDDGIEPTIYKYKAGSDQSEGLVATLRGFRDEGYDLNEIVVLSPLRDSSTAATTTDPWLRQILRPTDGSLGGRGQVQYSTIHSFKGLESAAVIITDLDAKVTADNFDSLLYVGLTRATDRLAAFIEKSTLRRVLGGK